MTVSLKSGLFATVAILLALQVVPVQASPEGAKAGDVTVKRNADGSLEVFDVPETPIVVTKPNRRARRNAEAEKPVTLEALKPVADTSASATTTTYSAASETTAQPELAPGSPEPLFAVQPVVSNRKPHKTPAHRTWSHGISAL